MHQMLTHANAHHVHLARPDCPMRDGHGAFMFSDVITDVTFLCGCAQAVEPVDFNELGAGDAW